MLDDHCVVVLWMRTRRRRRHSSLMRYICTRTDITTLLLLLLLLLLSLFVIRDGFSRLLLLATQRVGCQRKYTWDSEVYMHPCVANSTEVAAAASIGIESLQQQANDSPDDLKTNHDKKIGMYCSIISIRETLRITKWLKCLWSNTAKCLRHPIDIEMLLGKK